MWYKIRLGGMLGEFWFVGKVEEPGELYKMVLFVLGKGYNYKSKPIKTSKKITEGLNEYDGYSNAYVIYD